MKKFLKVVAWLLALVMFAGLFSACGEKKVVTEEKVWVDGEGSSEDTNSEQVEPTPSNTKTPSDKTETTSSGNKKPTVSNSLGVNVDPKSLKGTTVVFATWTDPFNGDCANAIKAFMKDTGIKVKYQKIPEANYVQEITGAVLADKAPDVVDANSTFFSLWNQMRPIEDMKIDTSNEFWDTNYINSFKVDGKAYFVNSTNNYNRSYACVYYNKKIFKNAGIKTPEQYYKEGNWTMETMRTCLEELSEIGGDITPGFMYWSMLQGSHGANLIDWKNGKVVSNYSSSTKLENFKYFQRYWLQLQKDGLVTTQSTVFENGKAGIAIAETWGLKKEGRFKGLPASDIGFTHLPTYKGKTAQPLTTPRGFGSPKKSKNPVGAGLFLRYYLDGNNYSTSLFKTNAAAKFFYEVSSAAPSKVYYEMDPLMSITLGLNDKDYYPTGDPATVTTQVDSNKNKINGYVNSMNNMLKPAK